MSVDAAAYEALSNAHAALLRVSPELSRGKSLGLSGLGHVNGGAKGLSLGRELAGDLEVLFRSLAIASGLEKEGIVVVRLGVVRPQA